MKKRIRQNNLTRYRNITYPSSSSHAHLTHSNFNYNYLHACINRYDVYVEHIRIVRSFRSLFTNLVFFTFLLRTSLSFPLPLKSHTSQCFINVCVCVCVCVYEIQGYRTRKCYHSLPVSANRIYSSNLDNDVLWTKWHIDWSTLLRNTHTEKGKSRSQLGTALIILALVGIVVVGFQTRSSSKHLQGFVVLC